MAMQAQQRLDPLNGLSDGRRADRLHGSAVGPPLLALLILVGMSA